MGCLSYLCVFDHRRYLDEVVPAMRKLYETGEHEPWLAAAWPRRRRDPVPRFSDGLRTLMKSSMAAPDLLGRPDAYAGEANREDIVDLFRYAVEATCLREWVYMGNSARATHFTDCHVLDQWELAGNPYVAPLMEQLDWGVGMWYDRGGGYNEGLNGWLDPDETSLLHDALVPLPLPHIEPSLAAVDAAYVRGDCFDGACPVKLAILRAFAALAIRDGHGLLWGGDLDAPKRVVGVVGSAADHTA